MKHHAHLFTMVALTVPTTVWAQDPAPQTVAAYDRCLAQEAVRVSYTEARNDEIFALAKRRCAATRANLARQAPMLAMLDATDATQAANFPDWMSRLRERRHLRTVGLPIAADVGYR